MTPHHILTIAAVAAVTFILTVVAGWRYGSRHTRAIRYADKHYDRPLSRRRRRALRRAITADYAYRADKETHS